MGEGRWLSNGKTKKKVYEKKEAFISHYADSLNSR